MIFFFVSKGYSLAITSTVLDPRIGVNHVGGAYPDRTDQGDFLNWGAEKAYDLGFQNLTVMMMRNLCVVKPQHPQGLYQTKEYCHNTQERTKANSLAKLAQEPAFTMLFSKPFNKFFIFTDSMNPYAAHQEQIGEKVNLTEEELQKTYDDYYYFTKHLLQTYKNTNKSFILIAPSELDWRLMKKMECTPIVTPCPVNATNCIQPKNCFLIPPETIPINNAIKYINKISDAVHNATQDNPTQGVQVFHACELNHVIRKSLHDPKIDSGIDLVIPQTHCDLIAYSAFETFLLATDAKKDLMTKSLDYIASKTPNHSQFGNKNIFISQFGFRENIEPSTRFPLFIDQIKQAINWDVPFLQLWTLYDDNCSDKLLPSNDECVGFWMIKPDGTKSKIYDYILKNFSISTTPSPLCICETSGVCSNQCSFNKLTGVNYPSTIKCNLSSSLFSTIPTAANKNDWCRRPNRTKGDSNGDNVVTDRDYFYYVSSINGGKVPAIVNLDFNGDGEIGASDREIIVKSL